MAFVVIGLALGLFAVGAGWYLSNSRISSAARTALIDAGLEPDGSIETMIDRLGRAATTADGELDAVAAQRDRFENALDLVGEGVVVTRADGVVEYANGFAQRHLDGRHGEALVAAAVHELAERSLRHGPSERPVNLFGPPARTMMVSATPIGEGVGAVVLIDDVSAYHRLDEVRRDFVANVSHELKTPVAAISLLTETMIDESDPATLRRLADRAHEESYRVGRIIDDLLNLSRLERVGGVEDHRAEIGLQGVIDEAVEKVQDLAASQEIELLIERTDVVAVLDHQQMTSAIRNLLENAIKYSDSSGDVELRVAHHDRDLSITVEDHGIGIPASSVDRIFERFYRVDRGRDRATGGTGLGLAIVNHVAANHGGTVEVASREGAGSTFTVMLPGVIAPDSIASDHLEDSA